MILIDSSVWIDYFNGNKTAQTDWLDASLGNAPIIMGDLILTEVLQGFQNDRDFKIARDLLLRLAFMPMGGQALALESATNYRLLRKKGVRLVEDVKDNIKHRIDEKHNQFTNLKDDVRDKVNGLNKKMQEVI